MNLTIKANEFPKVSKCDEKVQNFCENFFRVSLMISIIFRNINNYEFNAKYFLILDFPDFMINRNNSFLTIFNLE